MSRPETNLAARSGSLVESQKGYDPRIVFFHFAIFALLATLIGGLAYQQVTQSAAHRKNERMQNQRRILIPGPRGNIFDREGRLLVGNRPRLSVVIYLDEIRPEIHRAFLQIRTAYRETGDKDLPTEKELGQIARNTTVQRYLDRVNVLLHRHETVDPEALKDHFDQRLILLPFTLINDLNPEEYARLVEGLPVVSPLQLYSSSARYYPYASAAAHTLGYVVGNENVEAKDFSGDDLRTFRMKGSTGKDGLELQFDSTLQGEAGGTIFRVDSAGYKINPPLQRQLPVQGKNLTTSLDIDLQTTAEEMLGDRIGSVVTMDVKTGEVLVLASKPDYDLTQFSPHISTTTTEDITARRAWRNHAIQDAYPSGSTFKIVTSIAALRAGLITPDDVIADCEGTMRISNQIFNCDNGHGHHGEVTLSRAIAVSCDIYYYTLGIKTTVDLLAAEARRFHLDRKTGIELPNETNRMLIPDPEWKMRARGEKWFPGDTAHMAIGQGDVLVSPLDMACFAASLARDEVYTKPTLLHDPKAPLQHSDPIGLTPTQRAAIVTGMEECLTSPGATAHSEIMTKMLIPNVRIAGKTGTAQITGGKNVAWFICFAPSDKPEVAVAVAIEGEEAGENYAGGMYAAPVALGVLQKYFAKKNGAAATPTSVSRAVAPRN